MANKLSVQNKIGNIRPAALMGLLFTATILFLVGVAMPMITLSKFIYIRSSFSVISGVYQLMSNGKIVLAILVGGFSVVLPVVKIGFLYKILLSLKRYDVMQRIKESMSNKTGSDEQTGCADDNMPIEIHGDYAATRRYLNLMHEYGRWAMLDVMVVAVLIVTVKLGAIASIKVHAGLYIFGAAVLLLMGITHRVVTLMEEAEDGSHETVETGGRAPDMESKD